MKGNTFVLHAARRRRRRGKKKEGVSCRWSSRNGRILERAQGLPAGKRAGHRRPGTAGSAGEQRPLLGSGTKRTFAAPIGFLHLTVESKLPQFALIFGKVRLCFCPCVRVSRHFLLFTSPSPAGGERESMGLTSSKTIIPIKDADARLGPVLRLRMDKVRVHKFFFCPWGVVCLPLVHSRVDLLCCFAARLHIIALPVHRGYIVDSNERLRDGEHEQE